MTDDLVKRLRLQSDTSLMRLPENHIYVSHEEAADRIEELKTLVSYLAGTNTDHVRVILAGNPIVCSEITAKALAALEKTDG
jgi:hypothetical protein